MESRDLIDRLSSLMKLDHDALSAYDKAAAAVRDQDLQDTLLRFRHEHERHVGDFGEAIRREGGEPPDMSMAPRGVFFEGMTAAEGAMSDRDILDACATGEKYVGYKYRQAANEDFPGRIMVLIERHYADERRHLAFIESRLGVAASGLGLGRTIGLLALGVAAGAVIGRQIASR